VHQRLKESLCRLVADLRGSKEQYIIWGPYPPQEGHFRWGRCWLVGWL